MGLFDFFKKQKPIVSKQEATKPAVPEADKKYYQDDSYYTDVAFAGTSFEKKVITFEERKKTAIPSETGLYPAEILLLEYCSYGTYPGPKNGYPGFWWFEYGIRDVGAALKSLEDRGYIVFATAKDSLNNFTMPQLKEMLSVKNLPTTGKKADLVMRVADAFSEAELLASGIQLKYLLTELGQRELAENAYVPYLHRHQYLSVWEMNDCLYRNNPSCLGYRDIIWGKLNKQSIEHFSNGDFGLYRNTRLEMYSFLMDESKHKDALYHLLEVVSFDLSGLGNGEINLMQSSISKEKLVEFKMSNFFFDEEEVTIPPGVVNYVAKLFDTLGMSKDEFRQFVLKNLATIKIDKRVFSSEECANILLSLLGIEERKIKNSKEIAKRRLKTM